MHWFSFILGLLAGWIIEWVIDLAYWRRRYFDCQDSAAALRTELRNTQTNLTGIRARTDELEALRAELAAAQAHNRELEAALEALQAVQAAGEPLPAAPAIQEAAEDAAAAPAAALGVPVAVAAPAAAPASEPDDLVIIEGIGPAIARVLQDKGIRTFTDLALSTPDELRAILAAAGPRFGMANPATWPEQARLAARGDFDGLNKLQDRLQAGRA
ncbi:MAG: hypothetical protein ACM30E_08235 [Nitrososphaerales archaeon]